MKTLNKLLVLGAFAVVVFGSLFAMKSCDNTKTSFEKALERTAKTVRLIVDKKELREFNTWYYPMRNKYVPATAEFIRAKYKELKMKYYLNGKLPFRELVEACHLASALSFIEATKGITPEWMHS